MNCSRVGDILASMSREFTYRAVQIFRRQLSTPPLFLGAACVASGFVHSRSRSTTPVPFVRDADDCGLVACRCHQAGSTLESSRAARLRRLNDLTDGARYLDMSAALSLTSPGDLPDSSRIFRSQRTIQNPSAASTVLDVDGKGPATTRTTDELRDTRSMSILTLIPSDQRKMISSPGRSLSAMVVSDAPGTMNSHLTGTPRWSGPELRLSQNLERISGSTKAS